MVTSEINATRDLIESVKSQRNGKAKNPQYSQVIFFKESSTKKETSGAGRCSPYVKMDNVIDIDGELYDVKGTV